MLVMAGSEIMQKRVRRRFDMCQTLRPNRNREVTERSGDIAFVVFLTAFDPLEMIRMHGVFDDFLQVIEVHLMHEAVHTGWSVRFLVIRMMNQQGA